MLPLASSPHWVGFVCARETARALNRCNQRVDCGGPRLTCNNGEDIRVVMEEEPRLLDLKLNRFHAWDLEERRTNILHTNPTRHAINLYGECLEIWRFHSPSHMLAIMYSWSKHQETDANQETL